MGKKEFDRVFETYTRAITATDVDTIVGLYAPDAKIEIPVGGGVRNGIDEIRAFYRDNELAETIRVAGPSCVAGREGAVPLVARIRHEGKLMEIDVIDLAEIDEEGRVHSMRALFDLEGGRLIEE